MAVATASPVDSLSSPLFQRLLARYLAALVQNPLKVKAITTAILLFVQEIVASGLAGVPKGPGLKKDGALGRFVPGFVREGLRETGVSGKAVQMAIYGAFVSAPLSHFFVGFFQRRFAGQTGAGAKIAQIVAMLLIQSPITAVIYLACMAVINGARSQKQIVGTIKMGFGNVIKAMWISSPIAIAVAQRFLPAELWVVWFNVVSFVIGTYMTTQIKKRALRMQAKAKRDAEGK